MSATGEVLVSTTVRPGGHASRSPPGPSATARSSGPPGSERKMRSAPSATPATEPAATTPAAASRSRGAGSISCAITGRPLLAARFRHMGSPMTPKPIKPSVPTVITPPPT